MEAYAVRNRRAKVLDLPLALEKFYLRRIIRTLQEPHKIYQEYLNPLWRLCGLFWGITQFLIADP